MEQKNEYNEQNDVVSRIRQYLPLAEDFADLADLFKMFADSTRVSILWALNESEMSVGGIAGLLGVTESAVSHQLRTLRMSKLVKFRRDGKTAYYSLSDSHIRDILEKGFEHTKE